MKNKILKTLSMLFMAGLISSTVNMSVSAKASAIDIVDKDGKVYEYQYQALKYSASVAALDSTSMDAKLYNDFLSRKASVKAYYDDVNKDYVSLDIITTAVLDGTIKDEGTFQKFMEDKTTRPIKLSVSKITSNNGQILIDGQITGTTPSVDMNSIKCSNPLDYMSTVVTFRLSNVSDPQDYTVTVKGKIAIYNATTGLFGVTLDGKIIVSDLASTDFVVSKISGANTTISNIKDIISTVKQGDSYTLPSTVQATMSDGSIQSVNITWNKTADTNQVGTFTFNGTVNGYSNKVTLTLVVNKTNDDIFKYTVNLDSKMNDKLQQNVSIKLADNIDSTQYDIYLQGYFEGRKLTYNKNLNTFNYVIDYGYPNDTLYTENDIRKIIRIQKKDGTIVWNPSNDTYVGIKYIHDDMQFIYTTINQEDNYTPPSPIKVTLNDDTIKDIDVIWDKIDTSKSGKYVYYGSLNGFKDYSWNKLKLVLTIEPKTNVDESKIKIQHDDVENITWYMPETYVLGNIYIYIGENSSKEIWLRQVFKYHGDDYIYIKQYVINIDGQIYKITPNTSDIKYNYYSGGLNVAVYDTNINLDLIQKIASSTKTIIRLQGDNDSKDFIISQAEKDNITNILNKYNQMLGK
ncbi:hypothetical protein Ccar_13370 [Clostridium carboxidivorans P7]|uniref:Ig domain protein n=1 Tax=Clostridium carboxidivorans P7 TaxID=536227 RepID=C6PTI1_9CLOT|nr:Ig-like domain-containing protein [Clostridium carboxidivorans]AKN31800.1 hypothetical protein Ccar_13370 [Clostridium carboxidivorans P7]EET87411.1 Ig domain protein [Clostridium carboxidivorans P7]EFG87366.1 bacterial Ig-like domain (group 4) [Clostridium carboxidivorans P7]